MLVPHPQKAAFISTFVRNTNMKISRGTDRRNLARGHAAYFLSVDRRKRYFHTEAERDEAYQRQIAMHEMGVGRVAVTSRDSVELAEMLKLRGGRPESLLAIFKAGLASLPPVSTSLADAREQFLREKRKAVAAGSLKPRSLKQQRLAIDAMAKETGFEMLADVKNPALESWLTERKLSPKGLHSFSKALGVFLNWCVAKKYLAESPLSQIYIPEPAPKRVIFEVDEVARLFRVATKDFPDLLPLLALEWFAGIRPETAELLEYRLIHRSDRVIRLEVGKFSQGSAEFVENIPDTVWHWLPKRLSGRVAPPNYKHRITALHQKLGYTSRNPWPQDVARRTFVSHFVALTGSLDSAAFAINHKRPATTLKYYRRRVSKESAKAYFAIRPNATAAKAIAVLAA
ncbi:MAG: hypothetical protein KIT44_06595 [Opitutaceae bacterium]|nr:hypothetical protein [Opitutaceae bacterium]